ncbi:PH domain-containing protein [Kitasatospora sp. NPDC059599]|uniref:PH domain-containing protein n=1 Tax=Kitasatospora sp. NPDC059599 TaxID=3346880 RepID=UPI00368540E2
MNELIFRGKDLFRPSWSNLAPLLAVLTLQLVFGGMKLGALSTLWLVLGTLVLGGAGFAVGWRSWSRVGADGVTVCWGIGRGRTYPWQDIRWVDVRETKGNGMTSHAARIFLTDGRRRSLPGLQTSAIYPAADFGVNFQQVVNWWEYSTHATQRIRPEKQFRDRLTPTVVGLLLGLVIVAVSFVVIVVLQQP